MNGESSSYDAVTRRLIQATEGDLRQFLGVTHLDQDLVALLYLRILEMLTRDQPDVDEIVLTIYLTAAAWQSNGAPSVELLSTLHTTINTTLNREIHDGKGVS